MVNGQSDVIRSLRLTDSDAWALPSVATKAWIMMLPLSWGFDLASAFFGVLAVWCSFSATPSMKNGVAVFTCFTMMIVASALSAPRSLQLNVTIAYMFHLVAIAIPIVWSSVMLSSIGKREVLHFCGTLSLLWSALLLVVCTAGIPGPPDTVLRLNGLLHVPNDLSYLAVLAPMLLLSGWRGAELIYLSCLTMLLITGATLGSGLVVGIIMIQVSLYLLSTHGQTARARAPASVVLALSLAVLIAEILGASGARFVVWDGAFTHFLGGDIWAWIFGQGANTYISEPESRSGATFLQDARRIPWVHNAFLEHLIEQGIVGLAALLVVHVFILRGVGSPRGDVMSTVLRLSFLSFVLTEIWEATYTRVWVALVMGLLVLGASENYGRRENR